MAKPLTVKAIEAAKPDKSRRREISDGALPAFRLVVQPNGAKSWALRYRHEGKPKKLTIGPALIERSAPVEGPLPLGVPMTLSEARAAARAALQAVGEGRDPSGEKIAARRERNDSTLRERDLVKTLSKTFIDRYCKPKNRTWEETQRQFDRTILPAWGDRRVQEITKRDVLDLMDKAVDRGAPTQANRELATARRFFNWLVERDVLKVSPCTGVKAPTPESERDRVLSDDELRLIWQASDKLGWPFRQMVRLLLLTGQRLMEVGGMEWKELDLDKGLWKLPAARVKNKLPHEVPLSRAALDVLASCHRIAGKGGKVVYVLTTTGNGPVSGHTRAKNRLDAAILNIQREADPEAEALPHWTFHDLRRTCASGMARLGVSLPVVEKVLNHKSGSFKGVVGVYQRHDFAGEKRHALDTWAAHVERVVAGKPAGNVVPMKRKRGRA